MAQRDITSFYMGDAGPKLAALTQQYGWSASYTIRRLIEKAFAEAAAAKAAADQPQAATR